MKAVIDTNIVVSAIVFGGKPWEIIKLALQKKIYLFTSPQLIIELAETLRHKFNYSEERGFLTLRLYEEIASKVTPRRRIKKIIQDPSDNHVLETAVTARADFIVSGDKHLLKLKRFRGIPIVTAGEFLSSLEA